MRLIVLIGILSIAVIASDSLALEFQMKQRQSFIATNSNGIEGAIIPANIVPDCHIPKFFGQSAQVGNQNRAGVSADDFWTPSSVDIDSVESSLKGVLKNGIKQPALLDKHCDESNSSYVSDRLRQILSDYKLFRRQYIGLLIDGRKYIYINSFPISKKRYEYMHDYVSVLDGGSWYWQIWYDIEKKQFSFLSIMEMLSLTIRSSRPE